MTPTVEQLQRRIDFLEAIVDAYIEQFGQLNVPMVPTSGRGNAEISRIMYRPLSEQAFRELNGKHIKFVWRRDIKTTSGLNDYDGILQCFTTPQGWTILDLTNNTQGKRHNYYLCLNNLLDHVEVLG